MRKFWSGKIEFWTAFTGIVLMILTIIWRINPAEGSIVPHFLTGNSLGHAVIYTLLVTCMPVWFLAVLVITRLPISENAQWTIACGMMIILQGLVYFLIGKLIARIVKLIARMGSAR
jgi:hypothetical protein